MDAIAGKTVEDAINYLIEHLNDGWIIVEYESNGALVDFETTVYPPYTEDSLFFDTMLVQDADGVRPIVICKKIPRLRKLLGFMQDGQYEAMASLHIVGSQHGSLYFSFTFYPEHEDRAQRQIDLATWLVTGQKQGTLAEDS